MSERLELDSVGLHVLHNALTNIAAEMALVMMKTSYSTIFNEGLDFSTVLLDARGNLIAEKNFTPSMMGAIPNTVGWTLEEFGEEFFEPGDVVVHNDPYRGQCHLPEHMMMKPIFLDGERLFAYLEVDDFDAFRASMAATEVNDRWQAEMASLIDPLTDPETGFHRRLDEVFHLD